jgi:hypothetical protein
MCAVGVLIASGGLQLYVTLMLIDTPRGCLTPDPLSALVLLGIPIAIFAGPFLYLGLRLRGCPLGWRWHLAFPLAALAAMAQPPRPAPPERARIVQSPSMGRSMRDLAVAQEAAYDSRGRYAREAAELQPVTLPKATVVSAIITAGETYEIRIDSGVPVARSCVVSGGRSNQDSIGVFSVDCR